MSGKTNEFHILEVLAHGNLENEKSFSLPPMDTWTGDFCDALNFLEYKEGISFSLAPNDGLYPLTLEENSFDFGSMNVAKVKTVLRHPLPVDYVRFAGTVIFREENPSSEVIASCKNSMVQGLGMFHRFYYDLKKLAVAQPATIENLNQLTKTSILDSFIDMNGQVTPPQRNELSYDVINEILQNANDKVAGGIVEIEVAEHFLKLSYLEWSEKEKSEKEKSDQEKSDQEQCGFLMSDFLAVSSLKNSGNIAREGDTTGHKGTGFKGVYKWFQKVEIKSNGFLCTLDDTKKLYQDGKSDIIQIFDEKDKLKEISEILKELKENKDGHYPIPIFKEIDMENKLKTEITFYYRDEGIKDQVGALFTENFLEASNKHYFLSNIQAFRLKLGNEPLQPFQDLNREDYQQDHFYLYQAAIPENAVNFKEILQNRDNGLAVIMKTDEFSEISPERRGITILFPRKIPTNNVDSNVFVGLPVDGFKEMSGKFFVNSSLLQLQDNRRNVYLAEQDEQGKDTIAAWNKELFIYLCGVVLIALEALGQEEEDFRKIAYEYFPFHHLNSAMWRRPCRAGDNSVPFIEKVKFIHCALTSGSNTVEAEQLKSISELEVGQFLPEYMYQAMARQDRPYEQDSPFIYYPQDPGFFSVVFNKFKEFLATDETPFYRWALGVGIWDEPVLTEKLAQKLNLTSENNTTTIPLISDFIPCVKAWFAWEEEKTPFDGKTYEDAFVNKRIQLYFPEGNETNTLLEKVKASPEILYQFQDELQYLPQSEVENLMELQAIGVQTSDKTIQVLSKEMYWTKTDFFEVDTIFSLQDNQASGTALQQVCKLLDEKQKWNSEFFKILEQYNRHILSQTELVKEIPAFSFQFSELSVLSPWMLQLCENNIPREKLDSTDFPKVKNLCDQTTTLGSLLKQRVKICPKGDGAKHHWTFGYQEGKDEPFLVVFGERSLGKLMRDWFGIEHFSLTKHFTPMECHHPLPHFANWDKFDPEKGEHFRCKPDLEQETNPRDYKGKMKSLLIHHSEYKENDRYFRFPGYGMEKKCPICQAKLIIGQAQLHLRAVRLAQSSWTEILCCGNCLAAFPYAEQVYFSPEWAVDEPDQPVCEAEMIAHLRESNQLTLCFRLSNGETLFRETQVTALHRKWMLDELAP